MKSVGSGFVVLFLVLPYLALTFAVCWGAARIPWPDAITGAIAAGVGAVFGQSGAAEAGTAWAGGYLAGLLTLIPLMLTFFRIDRSAARMAGLVTEEDVGALFLPTSYWLRGFALVVLPLVLGLVVYTGLLGPSGIEFLGSALGAHERMVVALNHFDLLTTGALLAYFAVYGVTAIRRAVGEREPPALLAAWASTLICAVPFLAIGKVTTLVILDLLSLMPLGGFDVDRDLTLGHALAIQVTVQWCLFSTNVAVVLRRKLERLFAEIEAKRMLPD
ncbi:MAG: hypothetical protein AAGE80_18530 [Pseudomonadota bacterium]